MAAVSRELCSGDEVALVEAFHQALDAGVAATELREVILTACLFDGYPAALEGFRLLAKVSPRQTTVDAPDYSPAEVNLWRDRGERLCKTIYGPQYSRLIENVKSFAPELAESMLVEGYGKTLGRDGIDVRLRELCVVAMLAYKRRPRQLLSHVIGSLRLGAKPDDAVAAIETACLGFETDYLDHCRQLVADASARIARP